MAEDPEKAATDEEATWWFDTVAALTVDPNRAPRSARLAQSAINTNRFAALADDDEMPEDEAEAVIEAPPEPWCTPQPRRLRGPRPSGKPRLAAAFGGGHRGAVRDGGCAHDGGAHGGGCGCRLPPRVAPEVDASRSLQQLFPDRVQGSAEVDESRSLQQLFPDRVQGSTVQRPPEPWRALLNDSEDCIFAVAGDPTNGEKVLEVVVDSGAVQSVAPPGLFPGRVEPSAISKAGKTFRAANGSRIRNLGQIRVNFTSREGHRCSLPFQVAEVEHALLSVSHLARSGNKVELHDAGGRITNRATGRTMDLERRGGVYVLRLKVSGFPRPGAC